jgi:hypothetical protein
MKSINSESNIDDRHAWMSRETIVRKDTDIATSKPAVFSSQSPNYIRMMMI